MSGWEVAFLEDDYEYGLMKRTVRFGGDGRNVIHPSYTKQRKRPKIPNHRYCSLPLAIRRAMIFQHGSPDLTVFVEHAKTGARIPVRRWVESEMR